MQGGKVQLSLAQALALAIENNLDIAVQRYVRPIAEADMLRTSSGQAARGIPGALVPSGLNAGALGVGVNQAAGTGGVGAAGGISWRRRRGQRAAGRHVRPGDQLQRELRPHGGATQQHGRRGRAARDHHVGGEQRQLRDEPRTAATRDHRLRVRRLHRGVSRRLFTRPEEQVASSVRRTLRTRRQTCPSSSAPPDEHEARTGSRTRLGSTDLPPNSG